MSLAAGTKLGPYEILSPLGAGGMGEVYKARDTRLERTVAVKVLPSHMSASPEARQRFEREAKTISQLSHPHICALYDVGREGETEYLVMELLEGETLGDRLAKGPLPLEQALRYGQEIADALDKAHRQGIVHRDLKPGNVMLTKSGVKLLDFGLAKALPSPGGRGVGGEGLTSLPTQANLTQEGTILGTFQYMAPEQLEGKEADARTDIFALGAVLYEMATGRKAFSGATQASLIGAILHTEPAPISSVQPMSPPALDRVVRTCLAKDPEDRWQSAGDVAKELRWVGEAAADEPLARTAKGGRWVWAIVAGLGLALLASLPPALAYLRRGHPVNWPRQFSILPPDGTTFFGNIALSPDGRSLAFSARDAAGSRALWLRLLPTGRFVRLPGTEDATFAFWSPDSRHIGFFTHDKLKRTDPEGAPQVICDVGPGGRYGSWSKDGVILFSASSGRPFFRVSADGGTPAEATKLTDLQGSWLAQFSPYWLPDGRHFLYTAISSQGISWICLGSPNGDRPVRVTEGSNAIYSSAGSLLFLKQGGLTAQPFDPSAGRLTGNPVRVSEQVARAVASRYPLLSESGGELLIFGTVDALGTLELTWFDRQGKELGRVGSQKRYRDPSLSPDGKRIAAALLEGETSSGNVWMLDPERGIASRLSFHPSPVFNPIWSPDGSRIAFAAGVPVSQLFAKRTDGTGVEEALLKTDRADFPTDWSADGRFIAYEEIDPRTNNRDLWLLPTAGDRQPVRYLQTPFDEFQAQFAPDGKWMAYGSDESGRWEIYVQAIPAAGGKWQVSSGGGTQPRWRRDGRELFYLALDGRIMSVDVKLGSTPEFGAPRPLFFARVVQNAMGTDEFVPTADGQRFLATSYRDTMEGPQPLTVIVNWTAELGAK